MFEFVSKYQDPMIKIAKLAGILIGSYIVAKIANSALKKWLKHGRLLDETAAPILSNFLSYGIYAAGLAMVLDQMGVNTAGLVTLMGTVGLAIALSLKETLGQIASGVVLLFLRPFKLGDYIRVGEIEGHVLEVGPFACQFKTPEGLFVMVPNSQIWGSPIINFTRHNTRRVDVTVGIDYQDSIEKGLMALQKVVKEDSRFLTDPIPQFLVQSLQDSAVNIQLRAWVKTPDYWSTFTDTTKKVKEVIVQEGLNIPYPKRELIVTSGSIS